MSVLNRRVLRPLTWLILPSVVALLLVLLLWSLRTSPHVSVELAVTQVDFTLAGEQSRRLIDTLAFQALTVDGFESFEFHPRKIDRGEREISWDDPSLGETLNWFDLPVDAVAPVQIIAGPQNRQPVVDLLATGQRDVASLRLGDVMPGTRITLTVDRELPVTLMSVEQPSGAQQSEMNNPPGSMGLHVLLRTPAPDESDESDALEWSPVLADITPGDQLQFDARYVELTGIEEMETFHESLLLRAHKNDAYPQVRIKAASDSLSLITSPGTRRLSVGIPPDLPLTQVSFEIPGESGERRSAVHGAGKIIYSDYLSLEPIAFDAPDFLVLDDLADGFLLRSMVINPVEGTLRLVLEGSVGVIRSGAQGAGVDHRLRWFDALWHDRFLAVLFAVLVWVFATTVGAYQLFKELGAGSATQPHFTVVIVDAYQLYKKLSVGGDASPADSRTYSTLIPEGVHIWSYPGASPQLLRVPPHGYRVGISHAEDQSRTGESWSVFSFDLSELHGRQVQRAVLDITPKEVVGEPYDRFGELRLDQIAFSDLSQVLAAPSLAQGDSLSGSSEGPIDVTHQVRSVIEAGGQDVQFRLRFSAAQQASVDEGAVAYLYWDQGPALTVSFEE